MGTKQEAKGAWEHGHLGVAFGVVVVVQTKQLCFGEEQVRHCTFPTKCGVIEGAQDCTRCWGSNKMSHLNSHVVGADNRNTRCSFKCFFVPMRLKSRGRAIVPFDSKGFEFQVLFKRKREIAWGEEVSE